mmetsp:Transcript_29079/g.26455  ORF Transcript_29079/g.26455 Transcript_29079/m.26455 type:complete len:180 (+) Transcript_29079:652-1191(+)
MTLLLFLFVQEVSLKDIVAWNCLSRSTIQKTERSGTLLPHNLKFWNKLTIKLMSFTLLLKLLLVVPTEILSKKREYCLDYPKKDHIVVSFVSVTHPAMPHIKGNVRGDTKIAGYVMRPLPDDPNSTEMFILSQCDIKGMVPKFIVNYVAGKAPAEWIKKLTDACDVAKGLKKDKKKKKK